MDDQLRRRSVGAPAARSLLLTILGEYVLPRGEPVWHETLVGALVSIGYSSHAARQALARSDVSGKAHFFATPELRPPPRSAHRCERNPRRSI